MAGGVRLAALLYGLFTLSLAAAPLSTGPLQSRQLRSVTLDLQAVFSSGGRFDIDLDTLSPDAPATLRIDVMNSGAGAVHFTDSSQSCDCTSVLLPASPLGPGDTGVLQIEFDLRNRLESFESTVVFEIRKIGAAEPELIVGCIAADLRRDIWLSPSSLNLQYGPDDPLADEPIRSAAVRVRVEESLLEQAAGGVRYMPLGELPSGISVERDSADDPESPQFHLRGEASLLETLAPGVIIPFVIAGLDSEGSEVFAVVRDMHVWTGLRHEWRVEPADPFLGVFTTDDVPAERTFSLSLDPETPFQVRESRGTGEGLVWYARPDTGLAPMAARWVLDVTLVGRPVGIHTD